jgi:hypothetical protein
MAGLVPVIPIKRSAAPHRIGMAGSSQAMTGEGVTKAVQDEGGCGMKEDVTQDSGMPQFVITVPRTLRRHHRARPGDPDKEKLRASQHRHGRHNARHDEEGVIPDGRRPV